MQCTSTDRASVQQDSLSVLPQEASYRDDEEEVDEEHDGTDAPPRHAVVYCYIGVGYPDLDASDDAQNQSDIHGHVHDSGEYVQSPFAFKAVFLAVSTSACCGVVQIGGRLTPSRASPAQPGAAVRARTTP